MTKKSDTKQTALFINKETNNEKEIKKEKGWYKFLNRENLKTARENVGLSTIEATEKICGKRKNDRVAEWESGKSYPKINQLWEMGKVYHVDDALFLDEYKIKKDKDIKHFRNKKGVTEDYTLKMYLHSLLYRQKFLSYILKDEGYSKNTLVGSGKKYKSNPVALSDFIREEIGYKIQENKKPEDVLKYIRFLLEEKGIFVFKTFTHPQINPDMMRGVYISDKYAPIIALNRNKKHFKRERIFTIAHEIAHLFLDDEDKADSIDFRNGLKVDDKNENFCNEVAANLLLPKNILEEKEYNANDIEGLSKKYGVSSLFILHRLKNLEYISLDDFNNCREYFHTKYEEALEELNKKSHKGGGDHYRTMNDSNGKLFHDFITNLYFDGKIDPLTTGKMLRIPLNKI